MTRLSSLLILAAAASQANAHFLLKYPYSIGFTENKEGTGPCGGYTPDLTKDKLTEIFVEGDAIATESSHPTTTWRYRATSGALTATSKWTDLRPTVKQTGLGSFCSDHIHFPASFAGSNGIIQVIADSPDGILYQCAAARFVRGKIAKDPGQCVNATGVKGEYVADSKLQKIRRVFLG